MLSVARRIALLMLMLTLPFNGWALALAPACKAVSDTQIVKHPCCAEQKICAEHKAAHSHVQKQSPDQQKMSGCDDGAACQCSSAFSMSAHSLVAIAAAAPTVLHSDVHFEIVHADSSPPFRPPIHG